MDFYFRKVLKANGIKYTFYAKDKTLVVNDSHSPFNLYLRFDELGYTVVRRIPWDSCEFHLLAWNVEELLIKMEQKKIIPHSICKKITVPIAIKAKQYALVSGRDV